MALALEIVHLLRQGLFAWRDGSPGRDTIRAQDRRNGEIHPASGCANNTIDINPNHVAMIKPSPDGDSGMVQILGFSGRQYGPSPCLDGGSSICRRTDGRLRNAGSGSSSACLTRAGRVGLSAGERESICSTPRNNSAEHWNSAPSQLRSSSDCCAKARNSHCPGQEFMAETWRDIVVNYVCRDRAERLWQFGVRSKPACRSGRAAVRGCMLIDTRKPGRPTCRLRKTCRSDGQEGLAKAAWFNSRIFAGDKSGVAGVGLETASEPPARQLRIWGRRPSGVNPRHP